MATYELPQYQSVYRDLGSVKINEELRRRYVDNFAAADQIAGSVADMESLDFAGDQARKEELADKYNAELDLMSTQGNYENMGRKVATLARGFVNDYKPLKTNKANYDAYIKTLDEARKAGDLDEIDYSGLKSKARFGYAGLQYDEDGVLDENSYFKGQGYVKSVDLNALINEQVKGMKPSSWKNLGTDIPVSELVLKEDGTVDFQSVMGPQGVVKYFVTTKEGRKEVSGDRVSAIVDGIIYDPNVQLSLDQKTDLMTYDMLPADAAAKAEEIIASYDNKIDEVLARTDLSAAEKEQMIDILEENQETLRLKQAQDGDLAVIQASTKHDIIANAKAVAVGTHAFSETEFGKTIKFGEEYLISARQNTDPVATNLNVIMPSDALPGLGGKTLKTKTKFIEDSDVVIQSNLDVLRESLQKQTGEEVSNEDILNRLLAIDDAKQFEQLAVDYNMGPDKFRNTVTKILLAKTKRDLVQQKMDEAYADAGYSTQTDAAAEQEFLNTVHKGGAGQSISGRDMVEAINRFYNKQYDYETAIEKINQLQKIANSYKPADLPVTEEGKAAKQRAKDAFDAINRFANILRDQYGMGGNPLNRGEVLIDNMLKFKNKYILERDSKINKLLDAETKVDFKNVISFAPIGLDKHANHKATKEALKSTFEAGFPEGITFISPDGGTNLDINTYFKDVLNMDLENFEIVTDGIGLANVSRADGTPVLVVPVKDKETGLQKNALIDANAVGTGGYLESWINSAEYQMEVLWKEGEHSQVKTFAPDLFDGVVFDYNHPTGPTVFIDGKPYDKARGLQMLANTYANKGFARSFQDLYNNIGR